MAKRKKSKGRARRAAYAAGRYVGGTKGTAIEGVAGAASFYGLRMLTSHVEQVNKWWWAPPGVMLVAAHLLKKKSKFKQAGSAIAGAAGVLGAFAYETSKAAEAQGGTETQGFDTGILYNSPLATNTALDAFERAPQIAPPQAAVEVDEEEITEPVSVGEAAGLGI